ncbi:MAG TPA: hypothetical protein DHN33_04255 [Eubacteriaceae bacterium]|nr:hypothetical protein [Eubacteriaceae bacterium]
MFHDHKKDIYQPYLLKISILNNDVLIKHVELLDHEVSEFKHVHDSIEIYYALEGNLTMEIEEDKVTIPEGSMAFVGPGTWHYSVYEPGIERKYFIIIFDFAESFSKESTTWEANWEIDGLNSLLARLTEKKYLLAKDAYKCDRIIQIMAKELDNKEFGWGSILKDLYAKFIILSFRNFISRPSMEEETDLKRNPSNINLAIEITKYMHKNYQNNISLQDVAKEMHMSSRHINRVFEACFGTTFSRTLSIYRLNYAKDYFYNTDYSVEKVAGLVGFSSSRSLSRLFKEVEGMTIGDYKKSLEENRDKK